MPQMNTLILTALSSLYFNLNRLTSLKELTLELNNNLYTEITGINEYSKLLL